MSYNQERIDRFVNSYGSNPGGIIGATRNLTTGYPLVLPGESLPVLLSQSARLGPPAFPTTPQFPLEAITSDAVEDLPGAGWNASGPLLLGRRAALDRTNMALEVRYVGNKNSFTWAEENWNERSIFASEFRRVQEGTGQPAGEHCRPAKARPSPTPGYPAPHRCRCTWRI